MKKEFVRPAIDYRKMGKFIKEVWNQENVKEMDRKFFFDMIVKYLQNQKYIFEHAGIIFDKDQKILIHPISTVIEWEGKRYRIPIKSHRKLINKNLSKILNDYVYKSFYPYGLRLDTKKIKLPPTIFDNVKTLTHDKMGFYFVKEHFSTIVLEFDISPKNGDYEFVDEKKLKDILNQIDKVNTIYHWNGCFFINRLIIPIASNGFILEKRNMHRDYKIKMDDQNIEGNWSQLGEQFSGFKFKKFIDKAKVINKILSKRIFDLTPYQKLEIEFTKSSSYSNWINSIQKQDSRYLFAIHKPNKVLYFKNENDFQKELEKVKILEENFEKLENKFKMIIDPANVYSDDILKGFKANNMDLIDIAKMNVNEFKLLTGLMGEEAVREHLKAIEYMEGKWDMIEEFYQLEEEYEKNKVLYIEK